MANTITEASKSSSSSEKEEEIKLNEDEIAWAIPDELTVVLQTTTLLKIELDIDKKSIFNRIPVIKMREGSEGSSNDAAASDPDSKVDKKGTSPSSMNLLCVTHLGKLVDVIEKQGISAPMHDILEIRPSEEEIGGEESQDGHSHSIILSKRD